MIEINEDSFEAEVLQEADLPVVLDFWWEKCGPCLALMPAVEKLSQEYEGKVKFGKINITKSKKLTKSLKVVMVPTLMFYKGGELKDRISGGDITQKDISERIEKLLA